MSRRAPCAIILARGLGSRMRRAAEAVALEPAQQAAADRGQKAMMPVADGRPFLDFVLSALADAGITEVCLVVAPDHQAIVGHFAEHPPHRVKLSYAVQAEPTGTADAVLAAEGWTAGRDFLVLNADNLYPIEALQALVQLECPGVIAFDRTTLVERGNIPDERIQSFALLQTDTDGMLTHLVEKPDAETFARLGPHAAGVSMNLWRFDRAIFEACRRVTLSSRGERELPEAVAQGVKHGLRLLVIPLRAGVLDLSARSDVGEVSRRLAGTTPRP
jgi:glucose-1-phosphate thymidylyltransferase